MQQRKEGSCLAHGLVAETEEGGSVALAVRKLRYMAVFLKSPSSFYSVQGPCSWNAT